MSYAFMNALAALAVIGFGMAMLGTGADLLGHVSQGFAHAVAAAHPLVQ